MLWLGPGEQVGPRRGERHGPGHDLPAHAEALDRPDDQRPEVGEALARDAELARGQIADERPHRGGGRRNLPEIDVELHRETTKCRGGVAARGVLQLVIGAPGDRREGDRAIRPEDAAVALYLVLDIHLREPFAWTGMDSGGHG